VELIAFKVDGAAVLHWFEPDLTDQVRSKRFLALSKRKNDDKLSLKKASKYLKQKTISMLILDRIGMSEPRKKTM